MGSVALAYLVQQNLASSEDQHDFFGQVLMTSSNSSWFVHLLNKCLFKGIDKYLSVLG